ncbi:MAG: hypothetical protein ACKE8G_02760, partial [Methylophagaceae bacterium]
MATGNRYLSFKLLWLFIFSLLLSACGGQHATRSQSKTTDALYAQYKSWQGVPYRLGGLSKKGV